MYDIHLFVIIKKDTCVFSNHLEDQVNFTHWQTDGKKVTVTLDMEI